MRLKKPTWAQSAGLATLFAALAVTVAACGHAAIASTGGALTPEQQVKKAWISFFSGATSAQQKIALLENGDQYATIIKAQAASPLAKTLRASVTAVQISGAATATVRYSLLLNDTVVLADQTGTAVKQGGVWKVGLKSFQGLLALEGQQSATSGGTPTASATPSTSP
jgi:hypothetical protein